MTVRKRLIHSLAANLVMVLVSSMVFAPGLSASSDSRQDQSSTTSAPPAQGTSTLPPASSPSTSQPSSTATTVSSSSSSTSIPSTTVSTPSSSTTTTVPVVNGHQSCPAPPPIDSSQWALSAEPIYLTTPPTEFLFRIGRYASYGLTSHSQTGPNRYSLQGVASNDQVDPSIVLPSGLTFDTTSARIYGSSTETMRKTKFKLTDTVANTAFYIYLLVEYIEPIREESGRVYVKLIRNRPIDILIPRYRNDIDGTNYRYVLDANPPEDSGITFTLAYGDSALRISGSISTELSRREKRYFLILEDQDETIIEEKSIILQIENNESPTFNVEETPMTQFIHNRYNITQLPKPTGGNEPLEYSIEPFGVFY